MPSIQTIIDIRVCQFLGKIIRGQVSAPPRHDLIAYVNSKRPRGGLLRCNRECMRDSLARLLQDVVGIFIDEMGLLKDWYRDALDDSFWRACINHLKDPEKYAIPRRPNPNASFNSRSRAQQQNQESRNQRT
jgi:hypothetical protein